MNDKLHIRLFGGFEVCYGKKFLPFMHSMRMCSLLAYLVLNRQKQQTRQYLSFCFWPDTTEKQARTNLRQLIHKLRKTIPNADAFLEIDKHTIRWNPESRFLQGGSHPLLHMEVTLDPSNDEPNILRLQVIRAISAQASHRPQRHRQSGTSHQPQRQRAGNPELARSRNQPHRRSYSF